MKRLTTFFAVLVLAIPALAADSYYRPIPGGPLMLYKDTGIASGFPAETVYAPAHVDAASMLPPTVTKYVTVTQAVAANATLVAAVTGKSIRIVQMLAKSTANATIQLNGPSGELMAAMQIVQALTGVLGGSGDMVLLPYSPVGWVQGVAGEAMRVTVTGSAVTILIAYQEI